MATSFVRRVLEISVKLASNTGTNQPNTFAGTGKDTVTLSGSRASVRILNSGTPAGSSAHVQVWGLQPSMMNQLATLGLSWNIIPKNTILVTAGDSESGMTTVFSGTILAGYADYEASPDVPFHFEANAGLADAVAPSPAVSFKGPTAVADIMGGLARQIGMTLENNGVDVKLPNPYYDGSVRTQIETCARDANVAWAFVNGNTLAIWPMGKNRDTQDVPIISKDTGMIGYPAYTQQGIILKSLFNPKVTFGGLIKVQTSIKPVADVGTWAVNQMDLALDSLVPRGQWMMILNCWNPQYPRPVLGKA